MQTPEPITTLPQFNAIDDYILKKANTILEKQREKAVARRLKDERYRYLANGLCTLASGTIYATYATGWRRLTKKTNKYGSR
jgi:hypothetical protein